MAVDLLTARISPADFRQIAAMAYARAGLKVRDEKLVLVSGRLARRANKLGLPDLSAYCELLKGPDGEAEVPFFINALTTNHTAFFREAQHFDHLRQVVLPSLAGAVRERQGWVRFWCAASSTGEEPYTIAAVVRSAFGEAPLPGFRLLATDIDTDVLAKAERATYPRELAQQVPPAWRKALFAPDRGEGEEVTVAPAIAALVTFRRLNLIEPWPMRAGYAVIFCRNVFIYFDAPTKAKLVERFVGILKPGGFLYLGQSEFLTSPHPKLRPVGRSIYERLP